MQTRRGTMACVARRPGSPRRLLGLLLFTAFLGACGSTQTTGGAEQVKPRPPEPARVVLPIPNDVSYTIVSSAVTPGFKRTLDIRLSRKVSEEVLRAIATRLRDSDEHPYQRTFIMYYLPGMEVGSLAWATSHFDPDLQIRIIGVSPDQEASLLGKTAHRAGVAQIGKWLEEGVLAGVIIIYREDGRTFLERNFKDGSHMREEVVERPSRHGRRFEIRKPSSDDGAYYFIDKSGNLQLRDLQGIINNSKRMD